MKQSISWHRKCANNTRRSLEAAEKQLVYAQENVTRLRANADLYDRQIAEAERRGLSEFDDERLLITRQRKLGAPS
jgi:hypothetical protein